MTRKQQIEERINVIEDEIMYEEYKDRGYNFSKVIALKAEKA